MAVARERVADEHAVGTVGRQLAPCLVGELDAAQDAAALQREGPVGQRQEAPLPRRVARPPGSGDRQCGRVGAPRTERVVHLGALTPLVCHFAPVARRVDTRDARRARPGHLVARHGCPCRAASPPEREGTLGVHPRLPDPVARATPDVAGRLVALTPTLRCHLQASDRDDRSPAAARATSARFVATWHAATSRRPWPSRRRDPGRRRGARRRPPPTRPRRSAAEPPRATRR